jgi:hypothetical protein
LTISRNIVRSIHDPIVIDGYVLSGRRDGNRRSRRLAAEPSIAAAIRRLGARPVVSFDSAFRVSG